MENTDHPLLSRLPPIGQTLDTNGVFDRFLDYATARGVELYAAQEEALLEICADKNVILGTPTGSGKSLVAEAMHFLAMARGQRSVYTSPIKALVNEKFFALCNLFHPDNVGLLTGDATVNRDAPILCCTAEVLANWSLTEGKKTDVSFAILDEFHYYSDRDRGVAWQVPLLTLPNTTFLLMSATLGDPKVFAEKLTELNGKPTAMVLSDVRPVPLDYTYAEVPLQESILGLVEDGILRLEHHQLEDLAALLFAAGEAFVDEAGGELPVHLEGVHLRVELGIVGLGVEGRTLGLAGDNRGADEVGDGHTRDFARVLEREEETRAGDDIRLEADDLFAVEEGFARLHGVVGMAGEDLGERALTGAVRPHDGVHFAFRDREGKILQDRAVADGGVEILDDERVRHSGKGRGLVGVGVLGLSTAEEADLDDFGVKAGREDRTEALHHLGRELDVVDLAGLLIAEVRVWGQVRAIAGGLALVVDLADQAAADERFEAVVDRGEGEAGHDLAGAVKDLVDRGVVALG